MKLWHFEVDSNNVKHQINFFGRIFFSKLTNVRLQDISNPHWYKGFITECCYSVCHTFSCFIWAKLCFDFFERCLSPFFLIPCKTVNSPSSVKSSGSSFTCDISSSSTSSSNSTCISAEEFYWNFSDFFPYITGTDKRYHSQCQKLLIFPNL